MRWSASRPRRLCRFATTSVITKQVVSSLARHDIHIQEASQAKGSWSWMCQVQESRCVVPWPRDGPRQGRRMRRCARFGKWTSKQATARLWRTGAWAQKANGTAAVGAPPSWVKEARTRAAEAAQCGGRGRCVTTTNTRLRRNADPAVQIPCNLIRQWLIFWENNHRIGPKNWQGLGKDCNKR